MKIATILMLSLWMSLSVSAQDDAKLETEPTKTAAEAEQEKQRKLEAEAKARAVLEKKPVTYGGFLVDFKRAESKSRLLSLRQARDGKNDFKHLYYDERTERPKGFVLFSIGF